MKKALAAFLFAFLFALTPVSAHAKPLSVVATFSILGDFVKQVGRDDIDLKILVGPDGDAHAYTPTPEDSKALANADLFIQNGLGFEGWVSRLAYASGYKGPVVTVSDSLATPAKSEDKITDDPHAWQNVSNARLYVKFIASALGKALPEKADAFNARAAAYDVELEKLDAWVKSEIGWVPAAKRKIITSHDAFGYFGAAYGIAFISPQGVSTEVEPTAWRVARLVEQIKTEKIKRVFVENMANPKLIAQLAKDARASLGKPIYSDALSKDDGPAPTYILMIRYNVAQFTEAMTLNGE